MPKLLQFLEGNQGYPERLAELYRRISDKKLPEKYVRECKYSLDMDEYLKNFEIIIDRVVKNLPVLKELQNEQETLYNVYKNGRITELFRSQFLTQDCVTIGSSTIFFHHAETIAFASVSDKYWITNLFSFNNITNKLTDEASIAFLLELAENPDFVRDFIKFCKDTGSFVNDQLADIKAPYMQILQDFSDHRDRYTKIFKNLNTLRERYQIPRIFEWVGNLNQSFYFGKKERLDETVTAFEEAFDRARIQKLAESMRNELHFHKDIVIESEKRLQKILDIENLDVFAKTINDYRYIVEILLTMGDKFPITIDGHTLSLSAETLVLNGKPITAVNLMSETGITDWPSVIGVKRGSSTTSEKECIVGSDLTQDEIQFIKDFLFD